MKRQTCIDDQSHTVKHLKSSCRRSRQIELIDNFWHSAATCAFCPQQYGADYHG